MAEDCFDAPQVIGVEVEVIVEKGEEVVVRKSTEYGVPLSREAGRTEKECDLRKEAAELSRASIFYIAVFCVSDDDAVGLEVLQPQIFERVFQNGGSAACGDANRETKTRRDAGPL
jgi:hypothetical protein